MLVRQAAQVPEDRVSPAAHLSNSLPGLRVVGIPDGPVLLSASLSEGSAGIPLNTGLSNSKGRFLPSLFGANV